MTNILAAQDLVIQTAPYSVTGVPVAEVIRPTFGPPTLPSDPTQSLFSNPSALSASRIPLLITTVANEGGQAVSQILSSPTPPSNATYLSILSALTGSNRAQAVVNSGLYSLPASGGDNDVFRETFELAVTDGTWRCPNRQVARSWAGAGGKVWVGEWTKGETYPTNANFGYCTSNGRVCHEARRTKACVLEEADGLAQDDLYPTFGTTGSDASLVGFSEIVVQS